MDNEWRYSHGYPNMFDQDGNLNNYVDTRDTYESGMLSEFDTITSSLRKVISRYEC